MFEDRDLYVIGGGGLLAILCLLPGWPFWLKVTLALLIMILSLVLALYRFGHDRRTLEKHVYYELQFLTKTKNYSYFWRSPIRFFTTAAYGKPAAEPVVVTMVWDDLNIYILMTVWLAVIGIYFIVWLKNSGQLELSVWLQQIITLWR